MSIMNTFPGNPGLASTTRNGLMSAIDKTKLNGIAEGANNYTHPTTHPASIIVQDSSNRFVTDAQISTWNAKASTAVATTRTNGLMSSTDKTNLDNAVTKVNTLETNLNSALSRITTLETNYTSMLTKLKTAVFIE